MSKITQNMAIDPFQPGIKAHRRVQNVTEIGADGDALQSAGNAMTGNIQNKTGKTFVVLAPDKIVEITADQMMRLINRIHRYQQVVKPARQ